MANAKTLVVLEPPLRAAVNRIARQHRVSISSVCRELIREALEVHEDGYWAAAAASREKQFNWKRGLSHREVWGSR